MYSYSSSESDLFCNFPYIYIFIFTLQYFLIDVLYYRKKTKKKKE